MKKLIITSAVAIMSIAAMAQDRKVAVFDPAGSVDKAIKEVVREEISSIIVNTGGFTVLERQLIDKVLEENRFQSGGLVDDSQVSEIGKRMGANMVFVTNITDMGTNLYVSCKMIDVMTARIEKQKTAQTQQRGNADLINVVQKIVKEMFTDAPKPTETPRQTVQPVAEKKSVLPAMLMADGRKVYQGGERLDKWEVLHLMANTDALRWYNKGISQNKNGNIWLISGVPVLVGGACWWILNNDRGVNTESKKQCGIASIGVSITGAAMSIVGINMKVNSKKSVSRSVDMYNRYVSKTNTELKFGITGNGVGVALVF